MLRAIDESKFGEAIPDAQDEGKVREKRVGDVEDQKGLGKGVWEGEKLNG